MSRALASRLSVLEARKPRPRRLVVSVLSGEGQEAEVRQLLLAKGIDPDADDLLLVRRVIISPAGEEPWSEPPSILRITEGNTARRSRGALRHPRP